MLQVLATKPQGVTAANSPSQLSLLPTLGLPLHERPGCLVAAQQMPSARCSAPAHWSLPRSHLLVLAEARMGPSHALALQGALAQP